MAKKKKPTNSIDPNKLHPSIKYGIPLTSLGLLAWINIVLVTIDYFFLEASGVAYSNMIILGASIITAISFIMSFFNKLIERFQIFTYILIFLDTLITVLSMIFGGLAMYISNGVIEAKNFTPARVRSYLIPVAILLLISVISFTIYHQKKVVLKLNKGKALSYPLSFGTIVSVTVLGRHTSSSFSDTIAGIGIAVIGAGIFPGGAVGALFCIIDLIKHPELKNYYDA